MILLVELDEKVAAREMHRDGALAPAVVHRGARHSDGARAGRERLPRSALPDRRRHVVWSVDVDELDVRPLRKALVVLDRGAEPQELFVLRKIENHGMRVADGDWDRSRTACRSTPIVLPIPHLDRAHLNLDELSVAASLR